MHIVDVTLLCGEAGGGVQTYLEAKQRQLAKYPNIRHSVLLPGDINRIGRDVHQLHAFRFGNHRVPLNVYHWAFYLEALQPDLIEFGDPYAPAWAAIAAARSRQIPVVGFHHVHLPTMVANRFGAWSTPVAENYLRQLYSRCDLVLAPSRSSADKLTALGLDNVEWQPLGVDLQLFHPRHRDPGLRARLGVDPKAHLLIFAGRGAIEKNITLLLETARQLGEGYHLLLVGVGDITGVPDNVSVLPDFLSQQQLASLLASADALIHAGEQETFGLIAIEAMACGTPVIGIEAGAVAELIDPEWGELANAANARHLGDATRRLFEHDPCSLGLHARRQAEKVFGWERSLTRLLDRYRTLLNSPPYSQLRISLPQNSL